MTNTARPAHNFHVPVMGTGFTVDTPLKVARFGISSVVSIGDDHLLEQMRAACSKKAGVEYHPIDSSEPDSRINRIRSYLNLLDDMVRKQFEEVRTGSFDTPGDLTKYFELLPEGELKTAYTEMQACPDPAQKAVLQADLRERMVVGRIDVNIMAKVDGEHIFDGKGDVPLAGVARTALRAFATSKLRSRVVISAGINKKLLASFANYPDFLPSDGLPPKKGVVIKVSDYRSALLQGKLLARYGVWVSEFRVESGLNCGGHAFASVGELMGPILDEFLAKRETLQGLLMDAYTKALAGLNRSPRGDESFELSAQGGVGNNSEHSFLINHFGINSVGWGTPFLLVPEVTNVDPAHLKKLVAADDNDVTLSDASPLGVPFWLLKTSASEENRKRKIADGVPGSVCPKRFLASDTEFTEAPICRASRTYQKKKLRQLSQISMSTQQAEAATAAIVVKACLCSDLSASAQQVNGMGTDTHTAICCGPSIIDYNRILTLKEMVDHIYGRLMVTSNADRPHMFIRELSQYVNYLAEQVEKKAQGMADYPEKYFAEFRCNLLEGIEYYREMASRLKDQVREDFLEALEKYENQLTLATVPG